MLVDEVVGRRRYRVLATVLIVLICALVLPAAASAEELTVDSTADLDDAMPGVGCSTALEECTLRAAIEESNASAGEFDTIGFAETVFDGGQAVPSTIAPGSSLPAVVDPVGIDGKACPTAAGVQGPCVGIDGPGGEPALIVEAELVEILGLAVTGALTGISIEGSESFKAQADWFGVKLDGSAGGNARGVFVGPESAEARIGGEGPEARNVFANNTGDGLDIHGSSEVRVLGNYFGVKPDGVTPAPNGKDVEVTSTAGGEFEAIGNAIGTKVRAEGVATAGCDFGCNVISGSASSGIDLVGDGGAEAPAVATTIAGNYIGLDATGAAPVPNTTLGVRVGRAVQTVIGGPRAGDANHINGGSTGVLAGPAAEDLIVRGNLVGVNPTGTGTLAPPAEGIVVNSQGLETQAVEAVIADNEIRMEGGVALSQQAFGATISGNEITGAKTGIRTFGVVGKHGNLIEGNSIEGLELNGILVENGLNEILGNKISNVLGGVGIRIQGSVPSVTENLVGGDAATDENVIAGSGSDAIEIVGVKKSENEVARNRGTANGGLFIDLVAFSPATEPGPNFGIEPPGFSSSVLRESASGAAEAGAKVRVFRKQSAEVGELESFLGEATADAEGSWKVVYGSAIPAGTIVAATQTNKAGGTSELATATTVGEGESGGGGAAASAAGSPGEVGGTGVRTRPRTKIMKAPKRRSRSRTARFEFESDERGSRFLCKLDDKPFDLCKSPKRYEGLEPGRHVFRVRAIDPAGHADPSPAKTKFTVLG